MRLIEAYAETLDTDTRWTRPMTTPSGNSEGRPAGGRRNSCRSDNWEESAPHGGAEEQECKKKFKVTPLERAWILYDVGNSAFVLMIATLVPIFFNALAEAGGVSKVNYLAYWGYASSVVTVITAVLGPILGTLADTKNFKSPSSCSACSWVCWAAVPWARPALAAVPGHLHRGQDRLFGQSGVLRLHAGRCDHPERMDMVSSRGYAWGYIGSCVPFVVCLALVLGSGAIGMSQMTALTIALFITAAWWLVTTLPLLRYRQVNYVEVEQHAIRQSFVRIGHTLKHLYEDKQVFWFLLAFFCYIDGVYTIIDMATAYGTALVWTPPACCWRCWSPRSWPFLGADLRPAERKIPSSQLIPVCIAAYTGIAVFAFFHPAVAVLGAGRDGGDVPGGVQALSRSHFAKIIPAEKSGEYFGLFDICGKGHPSGHHDRQCGQPAYRQCQCGRGQHRGTVRHRLCAVPGVVPDGTRQAGVTHVLKGSSVHAQGPFCLQTGNCVLER